VIEKLFEDISFGASEKAVKPLPSIATIFDEGKL